MQKHVLISAALVLGLLTTDKAMARNGPSAPVQGTRAEICGTQTTNTSEPGIQQADQTIVLLTVEAPNGFTDPNKKAARQRVMSQLPGNGKYVCITGMFFQDRGGVVRMTADERSQ